MQIPMSDGTTATYTKGSFHVLYDGAVYLNYNRSGPHVFAPNCVGKKTKDGLQIKSGKKDAIVLRKAKTIMLSVKDLDGDKGNKRTLSSTTSESSTTTYIEGSFEIHHNGETYLYIGKMPLLLIPANNTEAFIKNRNLHIPIAFGRTIQNYEFERQTDETSNKRRRLDEDASHRYTSTEKRAAVLRKNAPRAVELANKALDVLKELDAFLAASREEAGTADEMFEADETPLSEADAAIRAVIELAGAEMDE
jgi:hypothetical protein